MTLLHPVPVLRQGPTGIVAVMTTRYGPRPWHEVPSNAVFLDRLKGVITDGRLLIFLGAGMSFGAGRAGSRRNFDLGKYRGTDMYESPDSVLLPDDDHEPLPSWPWLVRRMCREILLHTAEGEHYELQKFFVEEGPLDCAQLFRETVGASNYRDFLVRQFDTSALSIDPTPSHAALVRLDLPLLFTTNYDELIEAAYRQATLSLRVSISESQFRARRAERPPRHLVKLHGSIDQPETVVLTRMDYAAARSERKEMLDFLRAELIDAAFLFVGFSLSDPNFNLLHDDIRLVYGMNVPPSYTVQGQHDPVKERYLRSLGVNTIWLDDWNDLPEFLNRINPQGTPSA